jgi:hypothetical protein
MNVKLKSIVVSYSEHDEKFHRESLLEYTQGNALRILKDHSVHYHAIAVVETNEDADRAIANFSRQLRVARGLETPMLVKPRALTIANAGD